MQCMWKMINLRLHNGSVSKSALLCKCEDRSLNPQYSCKKSGMSVGACNLRIRRCRKEDPRTSLAGLPSCDVMFPIHEGSCFKEVSQRKTNEDIWCSAVVSMFAFTDTCNYTHSLNTYNHTWKRVEFLIGKTSWRVIRLYGTAFRKNNVYSSGVCHISRI